MSTAVATETRRHSPEDLLTMPDGAKYELVRGCLVERNMGAESSRVGTQLCSRLDRFAEAHDAGIVWGADNGYQCFPHDRGLVRRPDVSFMRRGRLPGDVPPDGWVKIAPDLVVEVVSPGDTAEELEEKLSDYHQAGVTLIWVVYPKARKARIFRGDGRSDEIEADGVLSGEDVLPGFHCPLHEVLPRRTTVEETRIPPANPSTPGAP